VGAYFRNEDVNTALLRLLWAAAAGFGALILACIAAVVLARHIARPIVRLAAAASRIGELEIGEVDALPPSVFRELDEQARAFNTMLGGLRWFETYVPKTLVRRLIGRGEAGAVESVEREVTVMFTDIAGFTTLSEGKPAAEVASFLNEHFAMIARAVEDTGGTVDKFIGDAVMAFWGAPEEQPDHAERACRAALALADAHRAENAARRDRGQPAVGIRVGIHSGPVTVGNIGAPGRMNYTIVGDTVNVGQRLESLCKQIYADRPEIAVALSAATAAKLGPDFAPQPAGRHQVPGRQEPIEVFKLV
jgi:class 3 adenylate cyclase